MTLPTLTEMVTYNKAQGTPAVGACPGLTLEAVLHPTLGAFVGEAEERTREYEFAAIVADLQAKGFAMELNLRSAWARRQKRREKPGVQAFQWQHNDFLAHMVNYSFRIERIAVPHVD